MTAGLVVKDLTHGYGAKLALEGIGFSVEEGMFCALLGPNGAGKSTLFALLTRLFTPRSGYIEIGGVALQKNPRAALSKLGVVFQQPTLDLDLSVYRNLKYFAALHGLSGARARVNIERALERLDMAGRADEKVRVLNGGHRRRMEIARALIHDPAVLLLDEPTVGLDAATRRAITDHVHTLALERGITVLWATHLVDEVRRDDRLVVLHQGKVMADGLAGDIAGDMDLADRFLTLTGGAAA